MSAFPSRAWLSAARFTDQIHLAEAVGRIVFDTPPLRALLEVQQEARDLAWLVTWGLELGDPVIAVLLPQLQLESAAKSALVRRALGVE